MSDELIREKAKAIVEIRARWGSRYIEHYHEVCKRDVGELLDALERAKEERDGWRMCAEDANGVLFVKRAEEAEAERDRLRAENERLRQSLNWVLDCPDCGGSGIATMTHDRGPDEEPEHEPVTCGCRDEARAALDRKEPE